MAAFNVVRVRVKPEHEQSFLEMSRNIAQEKLDRLKQNGLRRLIAIKTGELSYCLLGEWDSFDGIIEARPDLIDELDRVRGMLEDLGSDLGVTDPVSGEVVSDLNVATPTPRPRAARTTARKGRATVKPRATARPPRAAAKPRSAVKPRATAKKPAAVAKKTPARAAKRPAGSARKPTGGSRSTGKPAGSTKRGRTTRR
jgi:hypothetical protein